MSVLDPARVPQLYDGASEVLGPLQPASNTVRFTRLLSRKDNITVGVLAVAYISTVLTFIAYLLWPSHLPSLSHHSLPWQIAAVVGAVAIVGLQLVSLVQFVSLLHFTSRAVDPVPMIPRDGMRVAMLTTIIPSKEPWEIAEATLLAFKEQIYDGKVDAWVLDEEDDPLIKLRCEELGINHFSRRGVEEWNTESGAHKAKTKHGNHNAWRQVHEHKYDVVTQMDPDHKPLDDNLFLQRILGYFHDPDVAFVVAPQVYGNHDAGFVAKASAELSYLFHGVVQRGCNGLGAPVLIGTNHAFRPSAWRQIDGYQDCIIEDHLTAMRIPQETNRATGNRWKGIYTPDILTAGEGPTTWTDFFSQQKRWAYGIFEIATSHTPKAWGRLTGHQKLSFAALQFFYPSVALNWLLGNLLSIMYLVGGVTSSRLHAGVWAVLFTTSSVLGVGLSLWLRKFNLMPHERSSWAMRGMLLNLVTTPIYLAAGAAQLLGRPLVYKVTAKGRLANGDTFSTFRLQYLWTLIALGSMGIGLAEGHDYPSLYVWMTVTAVLSLTPVGIWWFTQRKRQAKGAVANEIVSLENLLSLTSVKLRNRSRRSARSEVALEEA